MVAKLSLDVPSIEPQLSGPFRVFLNSSDNDCQNNLNTSNFDTDWSCCVISSSSTNNSVVLFYY